MGLYFANLVSRGGCFVNGGLGLILSALWVGGGVDFDHGVFHIVDLVGREGFVLWTL